MEGGVFVWFYRSPIGLLRIVRFPDGIYYFMFGDDDTVWTGHNDPQVVASDISSHVTGCSEWDFSDIDVPENLSEWDRR